MSQLPFEMQLIHLKSNPCFIRLNTYFYKYGRKVFEQEFRILPILVKELEGDYIEFKHDNNHFAYYISNRYSLYQIYFGEYYYLSYSTVLYSYIEHLKGC